METTLVNHVEIRKEPGGWRIVVHFADPHVNAPRILAHRRLKYRAKLVGTGAGLALGVECRVTNEKGRYTEEASSYGNDRPDIQG